MPRKITKKEGFPAENPWKKEKEKQGG